MCLPLGVYADVSDPYVDGFKAWASELSKQGSKDVAPSAKAYVQDVESTERKAGYIGATLPLPLATKVQEGVYTIVGSQIWHNPSNFGLNNNISWGCPR